MIQTRYPDKTTANVSSTTDREQYAYDNNGNVTTLTRRDGQSITLAYDNLDRLISRSTPNSADNVNFTYDLLGRRTSANHANYALDFRWDNAGRLTDTVAGGKTGNYQYDAAGNRTRLTWPDGFYVTTDYDALNRPTTLKEQGSVTLAGYAYDDLFRRSTVTLGNGTTSTATYDNQSALSGLSHTFVGGSGNVSFNFTRNQVGEIVGHDGNNNLYPWTAANLNQTYAANGLNQYTAVGRAFGRAMRTMCCAPRTTTRNWPTRFCSCRRASAGRQRVRNGNRCSAVTVGMKCAAAGPAMRWIDFTRARSGRGWHRLRWWSASARWVTNARSSAVTTSAVCQRVRHALRVPCAVTGRWRIACTGAWMCRSVMMRPARGQATPPAIWRPRDTLRSTLCGSIRRRPASRSSGCLPLLQISSEMSWSAL